jgi:hypothetical protein
MFNKKPKEPAEVELIHVTFEEYCNALRFIKTALKLKQIPFPYRSYTTKLLPIHFTTNTHQVSLLVKALLKLKKS